MNSVYCCSLPVWRSFLKKGTPRYLFCLALDPPLGRYGQNIFKHVPGNEHFIPTKFHKHPLSRSLVKANYVYALVQTPPLFSPKWIHRKFIKILKTFKSFIQAFFHLLTWKLHKLNVHSTIFCIKIYRNFIKIRQNDYKSKKMSKMSKKFDFGMEPKVTILHSTCFLIIAMHSVCCCSLPVWRRSSLKKGTPVTYFCPALDPPPDGSGRKTTNL